MSLIGNILSLPHMALFFAVWIAASLIRPIMLLTVLSMLRTPQAALAKLKMTVESIQFLLFCNDKSWKAPKEDPESFFGKGAKIERKTVIFVRHGESTWNDTFNRGDRSKLSFILNFVPNLVKAVFNEYYFFVSGQENESWFYDSPLSEKGLKQANGVCEFLKTNLDYQTPREAELMRLMLGGDSQLVVSNLRRAISTMAVGFQDRLLQSGEKIMILSQLQEISRNPDALSITPAKAQTLNLAYTDPPFLKPVYEKQVDTSLYDGNKPITTNGLLRLQAFCDIAFDKIDNRAIIAAGHSLWFRSFFRVFLPHKTQHVCKKKKLVNGGVVGFTLLKTTIASTGEAKFMIDPTSITVLHGGF